MRVKEREGREKSLVVLAFVLTRAAPADQQASLASSFRMIILREVFQQHHHSLVVYREKKF